jgi:hypothetical protein
MILLKRPGWAGKYLKNGFCKISGINAEPKTVVGGFGRGYFPQGIRETGTTVPTM